MKKIIVQRSIENKLLEFTENGDLWIKGCFTSNCQGDTPDPGSNPGGGSLVGSGINFHRLDQYTPPVLLYNFENGLPPILSGNTEFNIVEKADPVTGTTKALVIGSEASPQPTTNLEVEAEIEWTDGPGRLQIRCLIEHAFTVYLNNVVIAEFPAYEVSVHSINNTDIRNWITIDVPITNGTNRLKFVRNRYIAGYWDYIVGVIYIGSIFKSIAQPHTASINTGDIVECEGRFYVALTDIVDTTVSPKDNPDYKNIQGGVVPHGDGYQLVTGTPIYTPGEYSISLSDASESNGLYGAHGKWSATFGNNTRAIGDHSLAVGKETIASGPYSHAEGEYSIASGPGSHVEGLGTFVSATNSHAEGHAAAAVPGLVVRIEDADITSTSLIIELDSNFIRNSAEDPTRTSSGNNSWQSSTDILPGSHVNILYRYRDVIHTISGLVIYDLGSTQYNKTIEILLATIPPEKLEQIKDVSFFSARAFLTVDDPWSYPVASHAEGEESVAGGNYSHAEGEYTLAGGYGTHAEGTWSEAYGYSSHAEGVYTKTMGFGAHSEGSYTYALGFASHAEGWTDAIAEGAGSHAEGDKTWAQGLSSHAEGGYTETYGYVSHAEGSGTTAAGDYSHAEGYTTIASREASHAEGYNTAAYSKYGHTEGYHTRVLPSVFAYATDASLDGSIATATLYGAVPPDFIVGTEIDVIDFSYGIMFDNRFIITSIIGNTISFSVSTVSVNERLTDFYKVGGGTLILTGQTYYEHDDGVQHAEGMYTSASGLGSHAEGIGTQVFTDHSHVEGAYTSAVPGQAVLGDSGIAWNNPGNGDSFVFRTANKHALPSNFAVGEQVYLYYYTLNRDYIGYVNPDYAYYDQISLKRSPLLTIINIELSDTIEIVLGGNPLFTDNLENIEGGPEIPIASYLVHPDVVEASGFAIESASHAEGLGTMAAGFNTHAEGYETLAVGNNSHTEGRRSIANGAVSHAEGRDTEAYGYASHTEGGYTTAIGDFSHAEGTDTFAVAPNSHTEGNSTVTFTGYAARSTYPSLTSDKTKLLISTPAYFRRFDGDDKSIRNNSWDLREIDITPGTRVSLGCRTNDGKVVVIPDLIVYEVNEYIEVLVATMSPEQLALYNSFKNDVKVLLVTRASWYTDIDANHHAEGYETIAAGGNSHAEGSDTLAGGWATHAEGESTEAYGYAAHAEGNVTAAYGFASHTEGVDTAAIGFAAHAEGAYGMALGNWSHSEGDGSFAYGDASHAEGVSTYTFAEGAHAEGEYTMASGQNAHTEGIGTIAASHWGHAEGHETIVASPSSHAEGYQTRALAGVYVDCNNYQDYGETAMVTAIGTIPPEFLATPKPFNIEIVNLRDGMKYYNAFAVTSIVGNNITFTKTAMPTYYNSFEYTACDINDRNYSSPQSSTAVLMLIIPMSNDLPDYNMLAGYAHAEGIRTVASHIGSHAEGESTVASGMGSHAEGRDNLTVSAHSHVEGRFNLTVPGHAVALRGVDNPGNGSAITVDTKQNTPFDDLNPYSTKYFEVGNEVYIYYLDDNTYKRSPLLTILTVSLQDLYTSVGSSYYRPNVVTLSGDANFTHTGFNDYTFMVSATTVGEDSWNGITEGSHAEGLYNIAAGVAAHAEGEENVATGYGSHAEGAWSVAYGDYSHVEGETNVAIGFASHAEGEFTQVHGAYSHTEGGETIAKWDADYAHAEGFLTVVHDFAAHAEGMETNAVGSVSHAEGDNTWSLNYASHAEGRETYAGGENSHAEGTDTAAAGYSSHAEGEETIAISRSSHAEGYKTKAMSNYVIRCSDYTDNGATATLTALDPIPLEFSTQNIDWINNVYTMAYPEVELYANSILYNYDTNYTRISSIDGNLITIQKNTTLPWSGDPQFSLIGADLNGAEVLLFLADKAESEYAHAEGVETTAAGFGSHAEGRATRSIGAHSHASGVNTVAHGLSSESTGMLTQAFGLGSHAEGYNTIAGTSDRTEQMWYQSDSGDLTGRFTTDYFYPEFSVGTELALYVIGSSGVYRLDGTFVVSDWYVVPDSSLQKYIVFTQEFPTTVVHDVRTVNQFEDKIYVTTAASGIFQHAEGIETAASGAGSHTEGFQTTTVGDYSHAEGQSTQSIGIGSHTEGYLAIATGDYSHAEGESTQSIGINSHAEGKSTQAAGIGSHAEGLNTTATGDYSHAEGESAQANMAGSHAEGKLSITDGAYSHAEGELTHTTATGSHAEGLSTLASGGYSHAEGEGVESNGGYSHAEGHLTLSVGNHSHAEGEQTTASGNYSHAEGESTTADGLGSHAEGKLSTAVSDYSHAEGLSTAASGLYSHAEGYATTTAGEAAHTEGINTAAIGDYSHAEGNYTTVLSNSGHAEGLFTATVTGDFVRATAYIDNTLTGTVTGLSNLPSTFIVDAAPEIYLLTNTSGLIKVEGTFVITAADSSSITFTQSISLPWTLPTEPDFSLIYLIVPNAVTKGQQHAEGKLSIANGDSSHTEGLGTIATGSYSHAEGESTQAVGIGSHAEGQNTLALGDYSHAAGINSQAVEPHSFAFGAGVETADAAQTVLGTYNIPTIDAALVIGNGTDALNLSNAVTVGWDGKITSAASSINIALSSTPATSTSPGTTGDICWDADYIYVCIATDTWKRTALTTW